MLDDLSAETKARLPECIEEAGKIIAIALTLPYEQHDPVREVGEPTLNYLLPNYPYRASELATERMACYRNDIAAHPWVRLCEEAQLHIAKQITHEADTDAIESYRSLVACLDVAWIKTQGFWRADVIQRVLRVLDVFRSPEHELETELDEFGQAECDGTKLERPILSVSDARKHLFGPSNLQRLTLKDIPNEFSRKDPRRPFLRYPVHRSGHHASLAEFQQQLNVRKEPVLIPKGIKDWPAVRLWTDPNYWLRMTHCGHRLIPVEIGQMYTDENWHPRVMSFGDFLGSFMIDNKLDLPKDSNSTESEGSKIGYFAQHEFLRQMPNFYKDIMTPDYCYVDTSALDQPSFKEPMKEAAPSTNLEDAANPEDSLTNKRKMPADPNLEQSNKLQRPHNASSITSSPRRFANSPDPSEASSAPLDDDTRTIKIQIWLGPANTISPAHIDSSHNIFCQVMGHKYIRLFPPHEKDKLYPDSMWNTAGVDVGLEVEWENSDESEKMERNRRRHEQRAKYPLLQDADYIECVVEPGDCLFIPRGWWHYVTSLTPSASVSFWWDGQGDAAA